MFGAPRFSGGTNKPLRYAELVAIVFESRAAVVRLQARILPEKSHMLIFGCCKDANTRPQVLPKGSFADIAVNDAWPSIADSPYLKNAGRSCFSRQCVSQCSIETTGIMARF